MPFCYLGFPVGANYKRLNVREPVVERVRAKLVSWSSSTFSLGGHVVMLKSVLTSLPIYFLSIFKAPSGIISSLTSLFRQFLWVGIVKKIKYVGFLGEMYVKIGEGVV